MPIDYGSTVCKLKSCRKKIIRKFNCKNKRFCDRRCYTKWMRGRKAGKYYRRKPRFEEKICNGIKCRGEKKFKSTNGEHFCCICRDAMKDYGGEEISVSFGR